jgi:GTP-binding protein
VDGLPVVAIVGRPNVGKSTLFNRIVGSRTAIVEDRARTTRDRLYGEAEWNARRFIVVDTGGLETHPADDIEVKVQQQARLAISEANLIVFVADVAAGLTPADLETVELLRRAPVPVIAVANKADNERREQDAVEFHALGWPVHAVSALHGRGSGDLLDAIVEALPPESAAEQERRARESRLEDLEEFPEPTAADGGFSEEDWDAQVARDAADRQKPVAVAIVGRPNVGKSSLLNALLGEERSIVSEIPGTTRDAIDTRMTWEGQAVTLIDTAGVRRRGKVASAEAAEHYAVVRALKAVSRAEVAILVIDAVDGLAAQDAHIAGFVVEEGKALVVALNKWDLVEKDEKTFDQYVLALRRETPFLDFAPVVSISAKSGQRVGRALEAALLAADERRRRVRTAEFNRLLSEATFRNEPPPMKGRRPKLFYGTQAMTEPPTFVIFARNADAVHFSYRRYLENRLRDSFGFIGTPLRLVFREREREPKRGALRARTRTRSSFAGPGRAAARRGAGRPASRSPRRRAG